MPRGIIYFYACIVLGTPALCHSQTCSGKWNTTKQISYDTVDAFVPQIIARGDTIHLLWWGDPAFTNGILGQGIQYSHSYDGGQTFSSPLQLANYDSASGNAGLMAVVGSYVYVCYYMRVDSPVYMNLGIFRSSDAGRSWKKLAPLGDYNLWGFTATDSSLYVYVG